MIPPLRTTQKFWSLKRSTTLPSSYWSGKPALTLLGGSDSTLGNKKRIVPRTMPSMETVKAVQAIAIQLPTMANRKKRRVLTGLAGALGGAVGLGVGAGLGGAATAGVATAPAAPAGGVGASGEPVTFFGSDMARILLPVLKESQVGCPPTGNVLVPTERMSTAFAHELLTALCGTRQSGCQVCYWGEVSD